MRPACQPAAARLRKRRCYKSLRTIRMEKTIDQPHYGHRPVNFDFLGVWDTVGALAFGNSIGAFHHINPGSVRRVAHALALDEERERFEPSYWNKPAGADTQVDEVWFSGCHTNIGGGYCDTNLSNIAFIWVLKAAQDAGISIDLRGLPEFDWNRSHTGARRDSYSEFSTNWDSSAPSRGYLSSSVVRAPSN